MERAKLLYCIATEKAIDVSELISQQICYSATYKQPGLWFPHLIMALCLECGVVIDPSEEKLKPGQVIAMEGIIAPVKCTRSQASTSHVEAVDDSDDEPVHAPQQTQEFLYQILLEQ
ncbi:hypothetical protein ACH5RR_039245 [Cinchona calisaya]|uniref:Uncharacterized protein n=1 Tax=Cinchona calisaya TaxID=153742 RepID=A0ABD2Y148_9GENT